MTSLLGLLAEYGVWPRVANAAAISSGIKVFAFTTSFFKFYTPNNLNIYIIFLHMQHLHDQLQWKIKACNVSSLSCSFSIEQPIKFLNFNVFTHILLVYCSLHLSFGLIKPLWECEYSSWIPFEHVVMKF